MALFGFHLLDFILHFRVTWASPAFLPRVILTTLTLSQELKKLYAIVSGMVFPSWFSGISPWWAGFASGRSPLPDLA